jgi:hypothetical protein
MHLGGCRLEVDFNVFPVTFLVVSVGKKIGNVYAHWCPFLKFCSVATLASLPRQISS